MKIVVFGLKNDRHNFKRVQRVFVCLLKSEVVLTHKSDRLQSHERNVEINLKIFIIVNYHRLYSNIFRTVALGNRNFSCVKVLPSPSF